MGCSLWMRETIEELFDWMHSDLTGVVDRARSNLTGRGPF